MDPNMQNNSSCAKNSEAVNMLKHECVEIESIEHQDVHPESEFPQHTPVAGSNSGEVDTQETTTKTSRRLSWSGKKMEDRRSKKYLLRSSFNSSRVLRSMSKVATVTPPPVNGNTVKHSMRKRERKKKRSQRTLDDEFSKIKKTVRYLLHRMSYEQSFIDAYSTEGWKGQSLEKIRPEMELQRAKSEILRCKFKLRSLFQQLDSLISEGRIDDSLFDSEGEICSEDIFCAKCRSKDVSLDNDIILCDGICDRGFHQMCLNPPLLKDDIPPGDEGWLCPGCDCKVDCLDLINEIQGMDLSIEDEWEKVFPEATAFASKNGQNIDLELPSDDSEDDDYDPEKVETDKVFEEGSSSDESDFTSTSEDLEPSNHNTHDESFGFPSDDSEDIDFDPDKPDLEPKNAEGSSGSDESDFTSDTDDLNALPNDASDANEVSSSLALKSTGSLRHTGQENVSGDTNNSTIKSFLPPFVTKMDEEILVPLSGKRQRERLDYKKLYDDAYGNNLSGSSDDDDDDWTEVSTSNKLSHDATREVTEELMESHVETVQNQRSSKRIKDKQKTEDKHCVSSEITENKIRSSVCIEDKKKRRQNTKNSTKLQAELANCSNKQVLDVPQSDSSEKKTSRSSSRYGVAAFQKLQQSFRENQYPSHETKDRLSRELGMNVKQVSKWFDKARHRFRVSATAASLEEPSSAVVTNHSRTSNSRVKLQKLRETFGENQYPNRETKESLARELNMTLQQVDKWFVNARHRFRVLASQKSPAEPGFVGTASPGETPDNISTRQAAGSIRRRKERQPKKVDESPRPDAAEPKRCKKRLGRTKETTGGSVRRETLVSRELRKRRLSK